MEKVISALFASKGLNRTSVGLKCEELRRLILERIGLNRTSVGLKFVTVENGFFEVERLNRTSVGLKLILTLASGAAPVRASIEPAWD